MDRSDIEFVILEVQDARIIAASWAQKHYSEIVEILFQLEFIGVKRDARTKQSIRDLGEFEFAYEAGSPNLRMVGEFMIHPAFWKALERVG